MASANELLLKFSSDTAQAFVECGKRNLTWVTGYGGGKTWAAIQKALSLMYFYPGYRWAICRRSMTALNRTTKQTFFKVCPPDWIASNVEGNTPRTDLFNGSRIYWMNVDDFSSENLRSLEVNGAIVDQAEDISESMYLTLDARIGRWDKVTIPEEAKPFLQINTFTGNYEPPTYHILLANVPDEGEFWWVYRLFDDPRNASTHQIFETSSTENKALSQENLQTILNHDEEWVDRWVHAKRGQGSGAIHKVHPMSLLRVNEEWIKKNIISKGRLMRVLDHGASAPTCCTWWGATAGQHFCYREYYQPDKIISYHRRRIAELSGGEYYIKNLIDPACTHKESAKYGGFWSTADEYRDKKVHWAKPGDAPPISFQPADNNEFATRNRINEHLSLSPTQKHPITGESPAPSLYYCIKSDNPDLAEEYNPFGAYQVYRQTVSQKKELLDTIDGKPIYSDERAESVEDHAYDTERYYVADHLGMAKEIRASEGSRSFNTVRKRLKAMRLHRERSQRIQ